MNTNEKFCQCCGMPMGADDTLYGANADSTKSADYCSYCYENGTFTFNGTMDEMIEICIPLMVEGNPDMTPEKARERMQAFFPSLKRWKQ